MAFARSAIAPRDFVSRPVSSPVAQPVSTPARRGFWLRLLDAMHAARQRQAEREIAIYLRSTGGRMTDEAEREIERRFLGAPRR